MKRTKFAINVLETSSLNKKIQDLKSYLKKETNSSLLRTLLNNHLDLLKENERLRGENVLLKTRLEYSEELILKKDKVA